MLVVLLILLTQVMAVFLIVATLVTGKSYASRFDAFFIWLLGIKFLEHEDSQRLDPATKILLMNHRSFADFFIDSYVHTPASHLSRSMVALVLPFPALYAFLTHRVLFFKRGHTKRLALAHLISQHLEKTKEPLIIYPEGHRNLQPVPLPLKPGGIKNCYEFQWPVQIVVISGKENVLSEKSLSLHTGVNCYIIRSKVFDPVLFESEEDFYNEIVQSWNDLWLKVYANRPLSSFQDFVPSKVREHNLCDYYRFFSVWGMVLVCFLFAYHDILS